MNKIKSYILWIFFSFFYFSYCFATDNTIKDSLLGSTTSPIWSANWDTTSGILWPLFAWAKTEIFSLVMVLAIWVFIFIGIKFASARWNPEEFKKAWLHLIYAILGVFFIFIAWWLVRVVSSLSL